MTQLAFSFGQLIRECRKRREWRLDDLAVQCGLSRTFLSCVERGTKLPSIEHTRALAVALRVDENRLVLARLQASMPAGFYVVDEEGKTLNVKHGAAQRMVIC